MPIVHSQSTPAGDNAELTRIPAARQVRRESADVDGDGRPDYTWMVPEPVAVYLDLEFRYRIVEGRGEVVAR